MTNSNYTLKIVGRGEEMEYRDAEGALSLERTYNNGHRLYCNDTRTIPLARRRAVIKNLCDYFDTKSVPNIFVVDEADKDRQELETLLADLVSQGHHITVEHDSAAKREQAQDAMYLGVLKAGKRITIAGAPITTAEEYWRWKHAPQRGVQPDVAPTDGPADKLGN
jgi:hypothetical protein